MLIVLDESLLELRNDDVLIDKILIIGSLASDIKFLRKHEIKIGFTSRINEILYDKGIYPEGDYLDKLVSGTNLSGVYTAREIREIFGRLITNFENIENLIGISDYVKSHLEDSEDSVDELVIETTNSTTIINLGIGINNERSVFYGLLSGKMKSSHAYELIETNSQLISDVRFDTECLAVDFKKLPVMKSLSSDYLWKESLEEEEMQLAIQLKALEYSDSHSIDDLPDFTFGSEFISSVKENGCLDGHYASHFLEICGKILIDPSTVSASDFRESAKSGAKQLTRKGYSAFRVHITKKGAGLRLMFWEKDGKIVFANVGPKNELYISDPQ